MYAPVLTSFIANNGVSAATASLSLSLTGGVGGGLATGIGVGVGVECLAQHLEELGVEFAENEKERYRSDIRNCLLQTEAKELPEEREIENIADVMPPKQTPWYYRILPNCLRGGTVVAGGGLLTVAALGLAGGAVATACVASMGAGLIIVGICGLIYAIHKSLTFLEKLNSIKDLVDFFPTATTEEMGRKILSFAKEIKIEESLVREKLSAAIYKSKLTESQKIDAFTKLLKSQTKEDSNESSLPKKSESSSCSIL